MKKFIARCVLATATGAAATTLIHTAWMVSGVAGIFYMLGILVTVLVFMWAVVNA